MKRNLFWVKCLLLVVLVSPAFARCKGTEELPAERVKALKNILGVDDEHAFRVLSEVTDGSAKMRFVLYSVKRDLEETVYLAGITVGVRDKLAFTHDVSNYGPTEIPISQIKFAPPRSKAVGLVKPSTNRSFDGCLNTFSLEPKSLGLHMNVFSSSLDEEFQGANDIFFILPEHGFLQPVLELGPTASVMGKPGKRSYQSDSVISVVPGVNSPTGIVWEISAEQKHAVIDASFVQNTYYQWDGHGFRKVGALAPTQLRKTLREASPLARCSRIESVRGVEYKDPPPNDPAP